MPIVLAGRFLVAGAVRTAPDEPAHRPVGRTLLVPAGVALLLATRSPVLVAAGAVVALVGVAGLLPAGTARLRSGAPAALAAMLLFGTGWFGADGLVTVLFTDGYGTSVGRAAIVLSAAPLAWAVTSLAVPRKVPPAVGLALAAAGVAVVADVLVVRARAGRLDPGRRRDRAGVPGALPALHPGRRPGGGVSRPR